MRFIGLLAVAALYCGTTYAAGAGQSLAQRSVCLACHQVDTKRVGPSFRDIALRYAGNEGAVEYLAHSIREGSRGLWGAIPMPAQRHVDPATAAQLAEWILSLAPRSDSTEESGEVDAIISQPPEGDGDAAGKH